MSTELEQRLHADMERAVQDVRVRPGLAVRAYRHHHQRMVTTRVVTAAASAAVLIAGTLTVAGVTGAFGHPPAGPQDRTTAYVISRVERAMSAPDMAGVIAFTRTGYPAGVTVHPVPGGVDASGGPGGSPRQRGDYELLWATLHTTKRSVFTASGQHLFDEGFTFGNGSLITTVVDYASHTWWTARSPRPASTGPAPVTCLPGGGVRLSGGHHAWPDFIRSQLSCGAYAVVGKQAVDGTDAVKITGNSGHLTLWVNPATYLPVRLQAGGLRTDFQWLRPTPAHRAMLNISVPAGFRQVPPPG